MSKYYRWEKGIDKSETLRYDWTGRTPDDPVIAVEGHRATRRRELQTDGRSHTAVYWRLSLVVDDVRVPFAAVYGDDGDRELPDEFEVEPHNKCCAQKVLSWWVQSTPDPRTFAARFASRADATPTDAAN